VFVHSILAAGLATLLAAAAPEPSSVADDDAASDRGAPQSIASWTSGGPALNQVNAVSPDPNDEGTVYASASLFAASQSAIYGSVDGARTWTPLEEVPSGEFFAEVYADPRGGRRVFAGTQASGFGTRVYRSTDAGASWSVLMTIPDTCVPSFAAASGADGIVVSCGTRAFASPDAGATWSEPPNPFTESTKVTSAPGGDVVAYGTSHFFRTPDGGMTWNAAGAAPAACPGMLSLRVDAANANSMLAGTGVLGAGGFQCGGVYRSADGGATWTATNLSGVYVTDVRFGPAGTAYACASYIAGILPVGGAWGSEDGGATWENLRLPTTGALKIAASKTARHVYAATPLGVYVRTERRTRTVHR
jgi:hypothetical protein